MRRSFVLVAAVTIAATAFAPSSSARSGAEGSFLDPDARVFTLKWPVDDGYQPPPDLSSQAAFPDGSVLLNGLPQTRLWPSGAVTVVSVAADIVGPAETLLKVDRGNLVRFDPTTGSSAPVANIGSGRSLILLDDGRLVFHRDQLLWSIEADGAIREIPGGPIDGVALAPIAGGRFVVLTQDALVLVEPDGARRVLRTVACCRWIWPLRDGRVLVSDAYIGGPVLDVVDANGTITPITRAPRRVYGNGDGVSAADQAVWPGYDAVHAADGSLLFLHTAVHRTSVRAVVPAGSTRARVAFAQRAFETFREGRVSYLAPVAGQLELELRSGRKVIERVRAEASGPEGELTLSRPPSVGAYELRLRLRTPDGGAEARADMDTRKALPMAEAVRRLREEYAFSDGDEAFQFGSSVRTCARRSARRIRCLRREYEWSAKVDGTDDWQSYATPNALVDALLGLDGIRTTVDERGFDTPKVVVSVTATRQQTGVIRFKATIGQRSRVTAVATIRIPGRRSPLTVRAVRQFRAKGAWNGRLRLPAAAKGRRLNAGLTVRASVPTRVGYARAQQTLDPIRLRGR
jgi:hypothetical protein